MLVQNVPGTSSRSCSCGSWLAHWEKRKGTANDCANGECTERATLGGHVRKVSSGVSASQYIVPLCESCNQLTEPFVVLDDWLVFAVAD